MHSITLTSLFWSNYTCKPNNVSSRNNVNWSCVTMYHLSPCKNMKNLGQNDKNFQNRWEDCLKKSLAILPHATLASITLDLLSDAVPCCDYKINCYESWRWRHLRIPVMYQIQSQLLSPYLLQSCDYMQLFSIMTFRFLELIVLQ